MTYLSDAALRTGVWLTTNTTPSPSPTFGSYTGDGWIGFAITFVIMAATILLVLDMTRRVRRTRYRGEIRTRLEAEAAAEDSAGKPE
jgi:hypothetical protein